MNFSQRYGYMPVREVIQLESIDEPLRNGLWSLLKIHCWDDSTSYHTDSNELIYRLCSKLWFQYFKYPLDMLSNEYEVVLKKIRGYFFSCDWNEIYDFMEFVANNYERSNFREQFVSDCNELLEKEMSAYRFLDGMITRITEEQEVKGVDQAIANSGDLISIHLRRALELLSDRNNPDYRNSIKESISAVESLVASALNEDKGTLGKLLKRLESELQLHPALKSAFSSLYGYTSDGGGIRHALMEARSNDFHDAKFMLVVCSSFVNFVNGKLNSGG